MEAASFCFSSKCPLQGGQLVELGRVKKEMTCLGQTAEEAEERERDSAKRMGLGAVFSCRAVPSRIPCHQARTRLFAECSRPSGGRVSCKAVGRESTEGQRKLSSADSQALRIVLESAAYLHRTH